MLKPVFVAVSAFLLAGCADWAGSEGSVTRADSAGIVIVSNHGPDKPLGWSFEPVLSLGGADSGAESFFQLTPRGLVRGSSGQLYVLDPGNRQVHVFDSVGAHLNTFGGEGEGPGEFQYPANLILTDRGELIVFDVLRRSLLTFGGDGRFLEEAPAPRPFLGGLARVFGDTLLYSYRSFDRETLAEELRLTFATPQDTTVLFSVPLPLGKDVLYEECGISIFLPPLFADPPKWHSEGRVTVISEPPEYSLRVLTGTEETMIVRREIVPEETSLAVATEYLGEGEKWSVGGGRACTVPPQTVVDQRGIASHVPVVADVVVSPEGWIWVQRTVPGEDLGPVDVFDDTGEYRGTLPSTSPWPASFGDETTLLSLEEDELDIQRVILLVMRKE